MSMAGRQTKCSKGGATRLRTDSYSEGGRSPLAADVVVDEVDASFVNVSSTPSQLAGNA